MAEITITPSVADDSIGILTLVANKEVIDAVNELAAALSADSSDVAIKDSLLKQCQLVQHAYNEEFLTGLTGLFEQFDNAVKIVDKGNKADVSAVKFNDLSIKAETFDPSAVTV